MNRESITGFLRCLITAIFVMAMPVLLSAGGPGPPPPPGGVPLDPLSWVLLAGAGGLVAKKIYSKKTQNDSPSE